MLRIKTKYLPLAKLQPLFNARPGRNFLILNIFYIIRLGDFYCVICTIIVLELFQNLIVWFLITPKQV